MYRKMYKFHLNMRKNNLAVPVTRTGCPERLCSLPHQRYSRTIQTQICPVCSRITLQEQRVWNRWPTVILPNPPYSVILWCLIWIPAQKTYSWMSNSARVHFSHLDFVRDRNIKTYFLPLAIDTPCDCSARDVAEEGLMDIYGEQKGAFCKSRQKLQAKFAEQILQQNVTNLSQICINKGSLWTVCYMQQAVADEPQRGKQW